MVHEKPDRSEYKRLFIENVGIYYKNNFKHLQNLSYFHICRILHYFTFFILEFRMYYINTLTLNKDIQSNIYIYIFLLIYSKILSFLL